MILCVTLNPCLDKTLFVPVWKPGDSVRGQRTEEIVGGKGNNVARALRSLGQSLVRPVTFLGGPTGRRCETLLRTRDLLDPLVVPSEAPTRVILTVCTEGSHLQTAFFDPDPGISASEAKELVKQVERLLSEGTTRALALSGSSPCSATHGIFSDLIGLAESKNVPTFVDTYGPALESIWGFWPTVLKLNRQEAARFLKVDSPSDEAITGMLRTWHGRGVRCGMVTDGPNNIFAMVRGTYFLIKHVAVAVVNPVGSGDCVLAGLIDGWLRGLDTEPLLRHAIACGACNAQAWAAGNLDKELVKELERRVRVKNIDLPGRF